MSRSTCLFSFATSATPDASVTKPRFWSGIEMALGGDRSNCCGDGSARADIEEEKKSTMHRSTDGERSGEEGAEEEEGKDTSMSSARIKKLRKCERKSDVDMESRQVIERKMKERGKRGEG